MLSTVTQLTRREQALHALCMTEYQGEGRFEAVRDCYRILEGTLPTLRERFEVQDYINSVTGVKHLRDGMGEVMLACSDLCDFPAKQAKRLDAFKEHLEHASAIVSQWPAWKRQVLSSAN